MEEREWAADGGTAGSGNIADGAMVSVEGRESFGSINVPV
jgi:hypothetical protein